MEEVQEPATPGTLPGILLSQGAEARVFQTEFGGRPAVRKERFRKMYRHADLDARLTARRLHGEARSMLKARKLGMRTPALYAVDEGDRSLVMELVPGRSVKDILLELPTADAESAGKLFELAGAVGKTIAKLHDGGLVHGDLTTSNMLVAEDGSIVLIDFGLSGNSVLPEDKAVDLYVLERALLSLHSEHEGLMEGVLASYRQASRFWSPVHNKLAQVRQRGRKRVMVG